MESSQVEEEGSSSESGWTMYIVSPTHESQGEEEEVECSRARVSPYRNRAKKEDEEEEEDEEKENSDDSMVSDASSGPSYRGIQQRRGGRVWRKEKKGREKEGGRKGWVEKEEGGRTPIRPVSATSRARR